MSAGPPETRRGRRSTLYAPKPPRVADSMGGGSPRIRKSRRSTLDSSKSAPAAEHLHEANDGVKSKPARKKSRRHTEAEDGDLLAMVKIGWGLDLMLATYNEKRIERGDPPVEQIDDESILEMVESRKETQRKNTRKYQARRLADARGGNIGAARKLKWSAQRIRSLQLWISNGKIGRFEEKHESGNPSIAGSMEGDTEEYDDGKDFDDLDSVADEREPSPEDNIQVASLPVRTRTEEMAVAEPTRMSMLSGQDEHTHISIQYQSSEDALGTYDGAAVPTYPEEPPSLYPSMFTSRVYEDSTASLILGSSVANPAVSDALQTQSYVEPLIQEGGKLATDTVKGTFPLTTAGTPFQTEYDATTDTTGDCFTYGTFSAVEPFNDAMQYTTACPEDHARYAGPPGMYQSVPPRYIPHTLHPEIQQARREREHAVDFLCMERTSLESVTYSVRVASASVEKANRKLADAYKRHSAHCPNLGSLRPEWHGR